MSNLYTVTGFVFAWCLAVVAADESEKRVAAGLRPPTSGQPYTISDLDLTLVWVAPGTFTMGSPTTERKRERDERQHKVTISRGFWLGSTEVKVDQWSFFAESSDYKTEAERGDGICQWIRGQWPRVEGSSWKKPGFPQTGDHPVVGISWNDAMAFCKWLTERERAAGRLPAKLRYTLPTEAEWEYACRAGYEGPFLPDVKNMGEEFWFRFGDGLGGILAKDHTHPTGTRRANAWGLYNVHGNVFEWCRDWYDEYSDDDVVDPLGPDSGSERITRGGAWNTYSASIRSAYRGRDKPNNRGNNLGFRHPFDNGAIVLRDEKLAPWPRTAEIARQHLADYYAIITHLDAQIGRVIRLLKEQGQYENTLIVMAGDSGLAVGNHGLLGKQSVYDEDGLHIPFIVSGGLVKATDQGKRESALCYIHDITPTICELAGVPIPSSVTGKSLVPVIDGVVEQIRDQTYHAYRQHQRAYRKGDLKLIEYVRAPDRERSGEAFVSGSRVTQLFDVTKDPWETHNLADFPEHRDTISLLRAEMKKRAVELGDTADGARTTVDFWAYFERH